MEKMKATTILIVKKGNEVAIAGDGQVTLGDTIVKSKAKKIRKIKDFDVVLGFAGIAADAFVLEEKFEQYLNEYRGNLKKSAVELAKDIRNDKFQKDFEASIVVGGKDGLYSISGNGDILEPEENLLAIGSGGNYAYSAGLALLRHTDMTASEIAKEALTIASSICIYTSSNIIVEKI